MPRRAALWMLIGIYAAARFLPLFQAKVPMLVILTLHIAPPAIFAWIHGTARYGTRGILAFTLVCLGVGNLSENLGVLTGFPFGHYNFTEVMGPKFLQVPILLGLAYVGIGYISWVLGDLILGQMHRSRLLTLPLVAAFIMVAWDLSADPIWSTLVHAWIWLDGGSYFGVPLTNFFGWYLTVYVFYQLFALYLRRQPPGAIRMDVADSRLAVGFYAVCAGGNLLLLIPRPAAALVVDAAGTPWKTSNLIGTCALISVFLMGAFALFAWVRAGEPLKHSPKLPHI